MLGLITFECNGQLHLPGGKRVSSGIHSVFKLLALGSDISIRFATLHVPKFATIN